MRSNVNAYITFLLSDISSSPMYDETQVRLAILDHLFNEWLKEMEYSGTLVALRQAYYTYINTPELANDHTVYHASLYVRLSSFWARRQAIAHHAARFASRTKAIQVYYTNEWRQTVQHTNVAASTSLNSAKTRKVRFSRTSQMTTIPIEDDAVLPPCTIIRTCLQEPSNETKFFKSDDPRCGFFTKVEVRLRHKMRIIALEQFCCSFFSKSLDVHGLYSL